MNLWLWSDGRCVLELGESDATALELVLYFDPLGGCSSRAAWLLSATGQLLGWAEVGEA